MDDDTLLEQFESTSFPIEDWHHRVHVKVAYLYLRRHNFEEALEKLRSGIRAYNAAKGIKDSPAGGYHETMTRFWLELIRFTVSTRGPAATADDFADQNPQLLEQKVVRFFYSRDRFVSETARHTYLNPDLTDLPAAPITNPA